MLWLLAHPQLSAEHAHLSLKFEIRRSTGQIYISRGTYVPPWSLQREPSQLVT